MKTKHLLSVLCLLFFNAAIAQKIRNPLTSAKKSTSFGAMAVIPVGKFGSTDLHTGGFANPGFGFYFDSKNTFTNGLSFISHTTYAWVPLDKKALDNAFTSELGQRTVIDGGKHQPFLTTFGLGYDVSPFKGRGISLGISAQAGFLYNSFKPFDITVYNAANSVAFTDNLKYDSHFSLAYVFGLNLKLPLITDVIDLQIIGDYSGSKFTSVLRGGTIKAIPTTQQIQMINVGIGFLVHTK